MSLFINAWLKLLKAQLWPEVDATVYSCKWEPGDGETGAVTTITYSYRVNNVLEVGRSSWSDPKGADTFHRGQQIVIRYDPKKPKRSYFPEKQDLDAPFIMAAVLVATLLLAVGFWTAFS
jgi:Protein of unknown function (DUF3592)